MRPSELTNPDLLDDIRRACSLVLLRNVIAHDS